MKKNDLILMDWAIALINLSEHVGSSAEKEQLCKEAEHKLTTTLRLGNIHAHYHLACLHSLNGQTEVASHILEKARSFTPFPLSMNSCRMNGLKTSGSLATSENFSPVYPEIKASDPRFK